MATSGFCRVWGAAGGGGAGGGWDEEGTGSYSKTLGSHLEEQFSMFLFF